MTAGKAGRDGVLGLLAPALLWPLRVALQRAARPLGFAHALRSADRRLLEDTVLAHHAARPGPLDVLFVGASADTAAYEDTHFAQHRFRTLDIDPAAARHGSRRQHAVACASRAAEHFGAESQDLIVCNGVFGWGLDDPARIDASLHGFYHLLRPGGELIVGWNDVPWRRPRGLHEAPALAAFEPVAAPPLGQAVFRVPGSSRHCFEFFVKPR